MKDSIYGGGYTCSICNKWNRTSVICNHDTLIPNVKLNNMEQTAVEWLECELKKIPFVNPIDLFKKAKEMEKEQIIEACKYGFRVDAESDNWSSDDNEAEGYYNKTFKK